jgi:hypothetical protein
MQVTMLRREPWLSGEAMILSGGGLFVPPA